MPNSIDHNTIVFALSQRLRRIIRQQSSWRVWLDTPDYTHGTYLVLHDYGYVERITVRDGEGDEMVRVRPSDAEIYTQEQE